MKARGILFSYLIGAPSGLFAVTFALILPSILTGEGLPLMLVLGGFGAGIAALVCSFLVILWPAGRKAGMELERGRPMLGVSFRYSLRVNAVIWLAFLLLTLIQQRFVLGLLQMESPPDADIWFALATCALAISLFVGCTLVTTFSIGLLICRLIKG